MNGKQSLTWAWSGRVNHLNVGGQQPYISGTAEAIVVKFSTRVGFVKSQHKDDESPLKGAWSGLRDPLYILMPPVISLEWLKLKSSNFACRLTIKSWPTVINHP